MSATDPSRIREPFAALFESNFTRASFKLSFSLPNPSERSTSAAPGVSTDGATPSR
jgi:hypothetical protein